MSFNHYLFKFVCAGGRDQVLAMESEHMNHKLLPMLAVVVILLTVW